MKHRLIILSVAFFVAYVSASETDMPRKENGGGATAVLQEGDIPDFRHGKLIKRRWIITPDGMDSGPMGLGQEAILQDVKVYILYTELATGEKAHEALVSHTKNTSCAFFDGLWAGAQHKALGDETRHSFCGSVGLIIRSGSFLILVSCHGQDLEKRKQVAELVASKVVDKIKSGGHILLPSDAPKD